MPSRDRRARRGQGVPDRTGTRTAHTPPDAPLPVIAPGDECERNIWPRPCPRGHERVGARQRVVHVLVAVRAVGRRADVSTGSASERRTPPAEPRPSRNELDYEQGAGHDATETFDQVDLRPGRPASRQHVEDDDARALRYRVAVHLQAVRPPSAYVALHGLPRQLPACAAMNPAPSSKASAPPKMNPRASAPRIRAGSRGRDQSESWRIASAKYAGSASRGMKSLKTMPSVGKSGTSRMRSRDRPSSALPTAPRGLAERAGARAPGRRGRAARGRRARSFAARVALTEPRSDSTSVACLPVAVRNVLRPRIDPEACEAGARRGDVRPRFPDIGARPQPPAIRDHPYLELERTPSDRRALAELAPSISSSRSVRPTLRRLVRSADADHRGPL